jgi:2-polyprenyl-6-methoxyphenol hydroxylase-like FAD-dependent oxidoreductase
VITPTVLISGASIAGPALAYWLNARGWTTTVVERFAGLRDDGQNIDVRGADREVAQGTRWLRTASPRSPRVARVVPIRGAGSEP